jgi:transposase
MKLYGAIDLHSNNNVTVLIDEQDQVVYQKRLPNDLPVIVQQLSGYQAALQGIVVESTYNWYWLVDGLMEAGFSMQLANTAAIRQYDGLKYTDDHSDARYLAQLLRLGILPTGYIYPKEERAVRDLLRRRLLLVRQRTMQHLSLQGLIARHTGRRLGNTAIKGLDREAIDALLPEGPVALSAELSSRVMGLLERAAAVLEEEALRLTKERPEYRLLTTAPGIGKVLGLTIALETGDIGRFRDAGHYASYARCVGSLKTSNGRRKGEGNRKSGNRYLAWAFVEAAHFATIHEPQIRRYYQRKAATTHLMVAKKAVANKMARACYHVLSRRTPFEVQRAFG